MRWISFAALLLVVVGCAPQSPRYRQFYSHLSQPLPPATPTWDSPYFLVVYVDARHLDYTDNASFFRTVAKHPSDCSKTGDVGHAWIYLQGVVDDEIVCIYGGHSGERGVIQAKYFDGIMNNIDFGDANPTESQMDCPKYEANPAKYLWDVQYDGYFEWGSGMHKPTFAAKIDITCEQFERIVQYIKTYDYRRYSLVQNQCSSFATHIASLAGIDLECETTINLESVMYYRGEQIRFWTDPSYARLTLSTPDVLEKSLMDAVRDGRMQRMKAEG